MGPSSRGKSPRLFRVPDAARRRKSRSPSSPRASTGPTCTAPLTGRRQHRPPAPHRAPGQGEPAMSISHHLQRRDIATTTVERIIAPDPAPSDGPWCVACGFQHDPDTHCAECTGVHQGGYCLTPEAIAELGRHVQLAARVEAAARHGSSMPATTSRASGDGRLRRRRAVACHADLGWWARRRWAG